MSLTPLIAKVATRDELVKLLAGQEFEVARLNAENAKLRELLADVLHGSTDQRLTDYESPSLEPSLRAEIRTALTR